MAVNRRVAVPLVVVVGLLSLTTALEAARRAGAGPTGAATGGGSAGCGEAVVTVAPIDPVLGPRVGGPTGQAGPARATRLAQLVRPAGTAWLGQPGQHLKSPTLGGGILRDQALLIY